MKINKSLLSFVALKHVISRSFSLCSIKANKCIRLCIFIITTTDSASVKNHLAKVLKLRLNCGSKRSSLFLKIDYYAQRVYAQ